MDFLRGFFYRWIIRRNRLIFSGHFKWRLRDFRWWSGLCLFDLPFRRWRDRRGCAGKAIVANNDIILRTECTGTFATTASRECEYGNAEQQGRFGKTGHGNSFREAFYKRL